MTDNIALLGQDNRSRHGDMLMHWAIDDAIAHLKAGSPDLAYDRLLDSVLGEQARIAGIRVEAKVVTETPA